MSIIIDKYYSTISRIKSITNEKYKISYCYYDIVITILATLPYKSNIRMF